MYNFKSTKPAPYVYMCTHKLSGRFYIGYRESNVKLNRTSDVDFPMYRSSSKAVKDHFDEFEWMIVAEFDTGTDAFAFEHQLIYKHWNDPLLLNEHCCHSGQQFRRTSPPWNKGTVGLYKRTDETKKKIKEKRALQVMGESPLKGKSLEQIHGNNATQVREKISESVKLTLNTPELKEKNKKNMLAKWKDPDFRTDRTASIKKSWTDPEVKAARSGENHCRADKTIYTFQHETGIIEKCTRVAMKEKHKIGNISKLISGTIKSSMGWKLMKGGRNDRKRRN